MEERVAVSSPPLAVAALPRRDRVVIVVCLIAITLLAWLYLVRLGREMSASMEHEQMMADMGMTMDMPWTATDAFFTFAMWAVMMVGMMTPSAAPMLLLFAASQRRRGADAALFGTLAFGLGYLLVWTGFSAVAATAQWALHQAAMLSPAMATSGTRVSAAILIAAGLYQVTPLKGACLAHCRTPLGFLMSHWRNGTVGAVRMGIEHGTYCLGCCWALMCVLFVVGVMNLMWVAALTIFVLLEKVGPAGAFVARVGGVVMIAAGAIVLLR